VPSHLELKLKNSTLGQTLVNICTKS